MPPYRPVEGRDYALARYHTDTWHQVEPTDDVPHGGHLPYNHEWREMDMVTLNLNPDGKEPFYRNYRIMGGLGVFGGEEYDLGDLAYQAMLSYGFASE